MVQRWLFAIFPDPFDGISLAAKQPQALAS